MDSSIFEKANKVISALTKAGYEAYIVGGFVRDMIMGREPHDADITTSATPEKVKEVFKDFKTIDTGLIHGTVTVLFEGTAFEITTYRTEKGYSDNRHPDSVAFTSSLKEDLSRRDFTVCALAFNEKEGFIDLFGGKEDIERKVIRCVGEAKKRFEEDALRILRCLRFASVLSFDIEKNTKKALFECKDLLLKISHERIFAEISKLLCGENAHTIIKDYSEILEVILPEIKNMKGFDQHNFHHIYDILCHTAEVVRNTPPLLHLRLAALFHDSGKADCFSIDEKGVGHFYSHPSISAEKAERALTRLKSDNETKKKVVDLVKRHDTPIEEDERIIKKKLRSMGEETLRDLIKLKRADTMGLAPEFHSRKEHFDRLEKMIDEVLESQACFSLKDLAIKGNDLLILGFKGREIGEKLNTALEAVIEGKVQNEKSDLLKYITNT